MNEGRVGLQTGACLLVANQSKVGLQTVADSWVTYRGKLIANWDMYYKLVHSSKKGPLDL